HTPSRNDPFSNTGFLGKMAYSWNTTLFRGRLGSGPGTILVSPPESPSRPARIRRNVDLPHPEGPTRHTNSPSSMVRSKSTMAGTSPAIDGYVFRAARAMTFSATATPGCRSSFAWPPAHRSPVHRAAAPPDPSLLVRARGLQSEVGELGRDHVAEVDGSLVLGPAVLSVHTLDVGESVDGDAEVGIVQHRRAGADRVFGRVDVAQVGRDVLRVVVILALHQARGFEEGKGEAFGHFGAIVEELTGADEGDRHEAGNEVGGERHGGT